MFYLYLLYQQNLKSHQPQHQLTFHNVFDLVQFHLLILSDFYSNFLGQTFALPKGTKPIGNPRKIIDPPTA